jgi:hypothetical protein
MPRLSLSIHPTYVADSTDRAWGEGLQRTIAYFDKVLGAPTARVRECAF